MRALVAVCVVCVVCVASSVAADTAVDAGVPRPLAPCVAALRVALARRYRVPRAGYQDEHYCELKTNASSVLVSCYGACNDRSCHNDACTGHDAAVDVTVERADAAPSAWTRDARYSWQTTWTRTYGATRATVVRYGERETERLPMSELRRLLRTLDACGGG